MFERLCDTGFYINFAKVKLFRIELLYLGHIIAPNTLKPDPTKLQGLLNASAPTTKKALLSLCAAANYLRAYVLNFSEIIKPLTNLTGKNTRFQWTQLQNKAFDALKHALVNATYLTIPKWDRPFIIFTDASETAMGAALAQLNDDQTGLDFICFSSKKFNTQQTNWSPTERELFAIV